MKQNMKKAIGLSLKKYNETYMKEAHNRIDNIVSQAGTDNTEIVDARIDSAGVTHTTLNNRILAETKMNDQHLVSCSGEYITAENTMGGSITNLEVLGNTIQNEEDLADIKSVGELQEDGTYKMSISSCGKNLFNGKLIDADIGTDLGEVRPSTGHAIPSEYIKCPSNTVLTMTYTPIVSPKWVVFFEYDNNKKLIKTTESKSITTTQNTVYIKFKIEGSKNIGIKDLMIQEGTVATPYEPYQENKCDILLPCQLEKVGDVSDRLYYDDMEKSWCIEKNINNLVFNGSETTARIDNNSKVNTLTFAIGETGVISTYSSVLGNIICDRFITRTGVDNYNNELEGVSINGKSEICINILKSKLSSQDVTGFKQWLSQNNTLVKYQLATPQKIVLPLSTQIQLNSFFGTTHVYMESGEVEGTIKCKIPKSIGATVQSLNNKTDILSDRIEAIEGLKDSQNMKYETDKGYLVCKETKNGVIDDLKIEGKTLVNNLKESNLAWSVRNNYCYKDCNLLKPLEVGKTYTYFYFNLPTTISKMYLGDAGGTIPFIPWVSIKNIHSFVATESMATLNKVTPHFTTDSDDVTLTLDEVKNINLVLLEGDHTQNPPSYFEGLMSVGQDVDKIEVLSRKEDGNLFDKESIHLNKFLHTNGDETSIEGWFVSDYIKVADTCYIKGLINNASSNLARICVYTQNKTFKTLLSQLLNTTLNISSFIENGDYIRITEKIEQVDDIIVCKNEISNQIYQSDKKQILFYNSNGELEPIQELHEWDSIEKHSDNKWYYHKRSGKVVLNGSEEWSFVREDILTSVYKISNFNSNNNYKNVICDKLNGQWVDSFIDGVECIKMNNIQLFVNILNSKLSTQDVAGFKQWLQSNNVTVVYQLAKEEVYELAPLHLDSYANETLILCNSGAISPKMEFSITSHINELVKAYGERVNLLEEKVYQYMVTQNRMQLASTYSADSVTFKVDYFSLCENEEEGYDEDLYNLILNNILVGKDNYNYDKMFTIILDYASWNQISWEQFDILVGLMDMQHNPPVEELPTEDEIEEDIIENEETPVE